VGVHLSVLGLYLAPVFKYTEPGASPPQTIISLPVHTAVPPAAGALVVLVAIQLLLLGL
jgi:hypothetical protein